MRQIIKVRFWGGEDVSALRLRTASSPPPPMSPRRTTGEPVKDLPPGGS